MRDERPGGHRLLRALAAAVFWLLVWQLLAVLIGRAVVLSPPTAVIRTLIALMGTWAFWLTLGASFLRILTGYLIGVLLGLDNEPHIKLSAGGMISCRSDDEFRRNGHDGALEEHQKQDGAVVQIA